MSDTSVALREQLTRIDRAIAETHTFQQETNKLQAEGTKLLQESRKLGAEHDKLRRDWRMAPWLLAASLGGGVVASLLGQLAQHYWR